MTMARSKVTAQGQISVPAEVRRRLGVGPGSVLEWHKEGRKIVVRRSGQYNWEDVHSALFPRPAPQASYPRRVEARYPAIHCGTPCAPLIPMSWSGSSRKTTPCKWQPPADGWRMAYGFRPWRSPRLFGFFPFVYDRGPAEIASAVEILLNHKDLTLQDSDVVAAALVRFRERPSVGFSDCLLLELATEGRTSPPGHVRPKSQQAGWRPENLTPVFKPLRYARPLPDCLCQPNPK